VFEFLSRARDVPTIKNNLILLTHRRDGDDDDDVGKVVVIRENLNFKPRFSLSLAETAQFEIKKTSLTHQQPPTPEIPTLKLNTVNASMLSECCQFFSRSFLIVT
jgi:hypothetical protein